VKFEIIADSKSWKRHSLLSKLSLLAPNVLPTSYGYLLALGLRDSKLPCNLSIISLDFNFKLLNINYPSIFEEEKTIPWFATHGAIPTSIKKSESQIKILFSGFSPFKKRFRLLTGEVTLEERGLQICDISLNPILNYSESDIIKASTSYDQINEKMFAYAKGRAFTKIASNFHPTSEIYFGDGFNYEKKILSPIYNEFALTRPFHFEAFNQEYLFFSRRTNDGVYNHGAACKIDDNWTRISNQVEILNRKDINVVYVNPFKESDSLKISFANDYLGNGLIYFGNVLEI